MNTYSVYVRVDENNRIEQVESSAFLADTTGWIKIAEGVGDRYRHAQGNYFASPIRDDYGVCRYALLSNKTVKELTQEELDAEHKPESETPNQATGSDLVERVLTLEKAMNALMGGIADV